MSDTSAPMIRSPLGSFASDQPGSTVFPSSIGDTLDWFGTTRQLIRGVDRTTAQYGSLDDFGRPVSAPEPSAPAASLEKQYGIPGKLTFDTDLPESVAQSMYAAKREEIAREDAVSRRPAGAWPTIARYGADFVAGLLDPVNVAATMIPFGPEISIGGGLGARVASRAIEGGISGAAGMVPLTALKYGLSKQDQSDYDATSALADIAMGAGIGSVLHVGAGALGDLLTQRFQRSQAGRTVAADPETRAAALSTSVAQMMEERPVEVQPVLDAGMSRMPEPAQSGGYTMVAPDQLSIDPTRFQFKAADEKGVTGALAGTDRWEPALANPITAWQSNDGSLYVVNGHQRTDLATRAQAAGQPNVQIPTRIYREADGYTPEYMRTLGAYQNIAEGSGTPIDAAKVLRDGQSIPEAMRLPDLPPRGQLVRDGKALAKLSPEAFGAVENGAVLPAYAAHVGNLLTDPKEQLAALDMLARAQPANSEQARLMVEDIRNSGFLKGAQTTLFGDEDFARSLVPERARVLDNTLRSLRRVKDVFRAAVEGEDTLTSAGNRLDRKGNVQAKTDNERLIETIQRNATSRGPLSDALSDAARELAAGKSVPSVVAQFLARARELVRSGESEGIQPGDHVGGAGHPGEAEPPVEGQGGFFAEPIRTPAEVARTYDRATRDIAGAPDPEHVATQDAADAATRVKPSQMQQMAEQQAADHEAFFKAAAAAGTLDADAKAELASIGEIEPQGRSLGQAFLAAAACIGKGLV